MMLLQHSTALLLLLARSILCLEDNNENGKKTFVISLKDIDSSRALLEQIYEKAQNLGFDFNSLVSLNNVSDSLLAEQPANQPKQAEKQQQAPTKQASPEKEAKNKDTSKEEAQKYPKTAPAKNEKKTDTQKKSGTTSKPAAAKSSAQAKKKAEAASRKAKDSVEAVSKKAKASAKAASKSAKLKASSTPKEAKSSKVPEKASKSALSKASISSKVAPGVSKGPIKSTASSASLDIDKSSAKSSIHSSSEAFPSAYSSMSASSLSSSVPYASMSASSLSSSVPYSSMSVSSFSSSILSSSMTPSASIMPETLGYIDKINSLDQATISSVMSSCQDCEKVNDVLVYKDGDVWRDYTGKIQMSVNNGVLVDKTGVFIGKDCGCKKEEIPQMGQIGETGIYQDKQVNSAQCQKQNNLMTNLASANSSTGMAQSGFSSMSPSGASTADSSGATSVSPSVSTSSVGTGGASDSTAGAGGASDSSAGTSGASDSSAGAGGASDSSAGSGDASSSPISASTPDSSMPATSSEQGGQQYGASDQPASQASSVPPTVPSPQSPIVFKAIKLKYDLACDNTEKAEDPCTSSISKAQPKEIEYKTQTVTIIDEKKLPPVTVVKTVSRFIVPETVSKTFTQILKAETVTITTKPDTVVRYAPPKTITKTERPDTVTITSIRAEQPEIDQVSEDMIDEPDEPVQKTVKPANARRRATRDDDAVTISKTVTIPYKGVECVPDCPCESEGGCDNPCMEIKCEIVE